MKIRRKIYSWMWLVYVLIILCVNNVDLPWCFDDCQWPLADGKPTNINLNISRASAGAVQMTHTVFSDWKVTNKRSANETTEDKLYKIKQYWTVKEFGNKNLSIPSKRIFFGKGINFSIKESTDGGKTWKEKKVIAQEGQVYITEDGEKFKIIKSANGLIIQPLSEPNAISVVSLAVTVSGAFLIVCLVLFMIKKYKKTVS